MASPNPTAAENFYLTPVTFRDLQGWQYDDHLAAFNAFQSSACQMLRKPYKHRSIHFSASALLKAAKQAVDLKCETGGEAKTFFEENFQPHRIVVAGVEPGFVTGFFEPLVEASPKRTPEFCYPLYKRPSDLVDVDDGNRPTSMDASFRFGKRVKQGDGYHIIPFHDRAEIQSGALDGRGLELVWLKDRVDVFFIHIQGSAKLRLKGGLGDEKTMRVTFSAKSGHPYTSVAKVLCGKLNVSAEKMTADKLADWMRANPDEIDDLLAHNRSFIFFKEVTGINNNDGPIAAAKVPLIAERSLAVDRMVHTFGVPFWVETDSPLPDQTDKFSKLMIAHDTGSAIVGAARGDLFMGTGESAGNIAGRIRHEAEFTILVPNP